MQPHRVLLPSEEEKRTVWQCVSFFAHPDHDVVMECVDGSDKYPAIMAKEATDRRLNAALTKSWGDCDSLLKCTHTMADFY